MRKLITFATPEYRAAAERLKRSACRHFDEVVIHGPLDIDPDFRRQNAEHFGHRRGYGYWIWKSYFILWHLQQMGQGDELMYCDSQCVIESDPSPMFEIIRRHDGIGLFHQRREGHKNRTWTRGDCFRVMGCDEPKYHDGDNLATTFNVWTQTVASVAFVREWLEWCCNFRVVSDDPCPNLLGFRDHRHDQSIASLLAIKRGLFTLCDCSQWGDGYRCEICKYPRVIRVARGVISPYLPRPRMSTIIEVSAIASCPMRCSYCPQDKLGQAYKGPETLTLDTFARCLDNLVPEDSVYFAGFVEPCLNPAIVEMIDMTLSRGHRTQLYTTGRGLKVDQAKAIASMPIERIVLHLPDADGHLSHCEKSVAVLDALAEHPGASCMAMDNQPHPAVGHLWNRLRRHHGAMHDRAGNLTTITVGGGPRAPMRGPIRCGVAPSVDHNVLLPSGELALCCMDYGLTTIFGNLATTPYADILRSPAAEQLKEAQTNGGDCLCRRCVCAVEAA